MTDRSDRTLDRLGAGAGIAAVLLFALIVMGTKALPAPNHSIEEIARSARDDSQAILRGAYLGMLFSGAFLLFGASVAARLRRAEPAGGWWLVALAGIAGTTVGVVSDVFVITLVRAAGHGVSGPALWTGYPSGPDGVIIAMPLAVFLLGAGLGVRASGVLPRWLGWLGIATAVALVVGAGGVMGREVDGGILGSLLVLGYASLLVWITGSSVSMFRRSRAHAPAAAPA